MQIYPASRPGFSVSRSRTALPFRDILRLGVLIIVSPAILRYIVVVLVVISLLRLLPRVLALPGVHGIDAHVGADLERLASPLDRPAEQHRPRPHGKREELPPEPGRQPFAERPAGPPFCRGPPRERGRVLVYLDGMAVVELPKAGAVAGHPDGHAHEPQQTHRGPGRRDGKRRLEKGQGGGRVGEGEVAEERLDAGLDERGDEHGELAGAQPADAAGAVGADGHARHGLDGEVAPDEPVVAEPGDVGLPEQVADEVVFADVAREEVDAAAAVGVVVGAKVRVVLGVGVPVEVALAEHVALANDARSDAHGVDGAVKFGMGRGHEHLVETAAAQAENSGEEGGGFGLVGGFRGRREVDLDGQLVDESVGRRVLAMGQVAHQLVDHAAGDAL